MSQSINIPEMCNESWTNMITEENGRHCLQCAKTVVDFTSWSNEEIIKYVRKHKNICGRLLESQLQENSEQQKLLLVVSTSRLSFLRKIAAIIVIMFCLSFPDTHAQQFKKPKTIPVKINQPKPVNRQIQGMIMINDTTKTDTLKPADSTNIQMLQPRPKSFILGKVLVK